MNVTPEKTLELLNKIIFFDGVCEQDKKILAQIAYFEKYAPGQVIIEQDTFSPKLYFIINGTVDVVIDGELIISFSGGGHVFGEMSFVNDAPTSARVMATSKVVMLVLNTEQINLMVDPIYYKLKMDIYRSCAEVLSKKLIATNDIAKSYLHMEGNADFTIIEEE